MTTTTTTTTEISFSEGQYTIIRTGDPSRCKDKTLAAACRETICLRTDERRGDDALKLRWLQKLRDEVAGRMEGDLAPHIHSLHPIVGELDDAIAVLVKAMMRAEARPNEGTEGLVLMPTTSTDRRRGKKQKGRKTKGPKFKKSERPRSDNLTPNPKGKGKKAERKSMAHAR